MSIRGVKYYSWVAGTGYGDAAKVYMLGLTRRGIPVTWTPLVRGAGWASQGLWFEPYTGPGSPDPDLAALCNRPIPYDMVIAHIVPEFYPVLVEAEPGKKVVGITVWETDKLPDHWLGLLEAVHHLVVPCDWNRQIFRECGIATPAHVVPYILPEIPTKDRSPVDPLTPDLREDDYVFYSIGTWSPRKGFSDTVQAYLQAFSSSDPVSLVLKTTARDFCRVQKTLDFIQKLGAVGLHLIDKKSWVHGYKKILERFRARTSDTLARLGGTGPGAPRILLFTDDWPRPKIEQLHRRGDCYVSLCHSEGWGLGAFEASGLGKPVIMTGYGGQLDFLPQERAYLVDYRMVPAEDISGRSPYFRDQKWAAPDRDHAVSLMRHVFTNQEEARKRGLRLGEFVRSRFEEEAVMEALVEVLEKV